MHPVSRFLEGLVIVIFALVAMSLPWFFLYEILVNL
jgi:hypothetical protein